MPLPITNVPAQAMALVVRAHRQQIGKDQRSARRGKRRREDERSIHVATLTRPRAGRLDLPMSGFRIEQVGEDRRAVESGAGHPLD